MMKNISNKYCLLLLIIILLLNQSSGQQTQQNTENTFQVGQTITGRSIDGRVFSIVSVKELKSKYFFIRLDLDYDSKNFPVKLFVYLEGNVNPLKVCKQDEIDSCYLSKEQMKENTNILLLTDSTQKSYGFTLRTYWSDIQHLQPNSEVKFYFSQKDQTQLYHLELNNTNFYQLRIILKPQTIRSPFDKIKIYGSFGQNSTPSENQYDFKSIHLWEDAEGVFLYGKQVKQTKINLLIVGEIQTVYLLSCEIIEKQHHDLDLGQIAHQYLQPGEQFMYHADFFKNKNATIQHLQFDQYVLTFSGFSGRLSLGFYLDEQKTKPLDIQPFEYLSDAQYVFKKPQIETKMQKGLYLYVHALQRKSVYSINFYGRNKTSAIKLNENIHEFIQIDTKAPVLSYFQIYHWANDTTKKVFQYSVSMTNVIGQNELQFRVCTGDLQECLNPAKFLKSSEIQNATVTSIGMKQTFSLSFNRQALQKVNHAQDVITVLIVIKNRRFENANSFVALDYHAQNRLQFLRESKPIQSRIKQGKFKVFKYQNQDRFLKEIRVYVSQIAGKVDVFSLREEPNQQNRYGKEETSSVIVFDKDLATKPIYLVLQGKQQSITSLQLVTIHKSSQSISAVTLTEDLEMSFKIKPQDNQVVQVSPVHAAIYFEYNSTGTVLVCGIDSGANDCEQGFKPQLTKSGEINIVPFNSRNKMFKIMNPSLTDNVQVKLVYHSNDVVHCQQRQIGKLYYEAIQKGEITEGGFQNNCYQFPIMSFKNIAIKLSRVDLGQLHYAVAVCNSLVKTESEITSDELRISGDKIQKECQNSNEKTITLMVSPHKNETEKNKVIIASKIKYLVEYVDERVITIPDGIAYDFEGRTSQLPIKIFYYDLVNKKDTTIKLNQYVGYGAFTVQVVHTAKKQAALELTNYDYGFSKADSYFLNPTFTITKDMLAKKQCEDCSLVIKVYSSEEIGVRVKFGIEVIQNHNELEDHQPVDGFLTTNSMDFFTYTTLDSKTKGSLIVEVNDYGRKCMRIYLSDTEYPDDKNFIMKQEGNRLVYKEVQPQETYYISLQAIEDCPYSVTVSGTKIPITKLKRGYSSPLSLKAGEVKFFMLQHLQKKQFRILSILQHGQTYIYMNKTSPGELEQMLMKEEKEIKFQKFQVQSDFANRMVLHQNNPYLTENSIYIIAVQAQQQTEGYLFYGDSNTNLQIISDTFINDQLSRQGDVFRGQYYGEGNITLQLNVIAGQLNLNINHPQGFKDFTKNVNFDKNFTQDKTTYLSEFEIKPDNQTYFLRDPVEVKFTALKPITVYSFRFVRKEPKKQQQTTQKKQQISSNKTQTNKTQGNKTSQNKTSQNKTQETKPIKELVSSSSKIQPGQPNYITVSNSTTFVIKGTLTHGEEIFLSSSIESQQVLNRLTLKGSANKKDVKIKKTMVRNIMKIEFVEASASKTSKTDYKLQVKSNEDINLTVYQNYGLNLLSPDQSVLIQNTMDYVLYPENSILIDLFECEDNASVLYSPSRSALDTLQPKSLDLIGMPNQPHAIKIINPGVTFLRVKSKKAYLRWLPIDAEKGKGLGYLDYDVGSILYENSLLKFNVQWQPVFAKRDTVTKIHQANYVLIIGTDPASIKSAINCQNYNDPQLLYYHYNTGSQSNQKSLEIELSKTDITQKYSQDQNIFVALVAQLVLRVPNEKYQKFEHYRFVYNTQQVPLQLFKQYTVTSKDTWIVALIIAGVVFLVSLTCLVCVKKVMPIISRFRQGNVMIEEKKDQKEFDVIPASSDRNEVVRDNLQTEDVMK